MRSAPLESPDNPNSSFKNGGEGRKNSRRQPEKQTRATLKTPYPLLLFSLSIDTMVAAIGRKPSECLPCGKNRENTDRRASMAVNGARR
jgi:hypothetical protein